MPFLILEEQAGRRCWINRNVGFVHVGRPYPPELCYPDRETAERDVEFFRALNVVKPKYYHMRRFKPPRKYRPPVYSVVCL